MPRGGLRSTSWKPTWKHGATRTIRVPIALADRVLEIAKALDEGQEAMGNSLVTGNVLESARLDVVTKAIAVDSLTTAIEMKRSAIRTESKKRVKANNFHIERWHSEIEALERVVAILESS